MMRTPKPSNYSRRVLLFVVTASSTQVIGTGFIIAVQRDGLRVKEGRSDGLREVSFDLLFDFDEPGDGR
jgi:hypothetical protein